MESVPFVGIKLLMDKYWWPGSKILNYFVFGSVLQSQDTVRWLVTVMYLWRLVSSLDLTCLFKFLDSLPSYSGVHKLISIFWAHCFQFCGLKFFILYCKRQGPVSHLLLLSLRNCWNACSRKRDLQGTHFFIDKNKVSPNFTLQKIHTNLCNY